MKRFPLALLIGGAIVVGLTLTGGAVMGAATPPGSSSTTSTPYGPMGSGMMGPYDSSAMMGSRQHTAAGARALTINQAQHRVQLYIKQFGNPHLVIDEILEFQRNFYAIVKDTGTGHGAFEVLVNKWSGLVFPEYGPAMMWNTQYGMMRGGMMGAGYSGGPMTFSSARAAQIARQWLARDRPGTTIEAPDQFPGYYTIHFRKNGKIAGMLSVNGYTGQVWHHTWHGAFIRVKEVNG